MIRSIAGSIARPLAVAITGASGGALALDAVTSAVLAFSFRRLRTTYTGPLCKLRRASDDAEADVDPDSSGTLSLASPVTITSGTSSATTLGEFVAGSGYTDVDNIGSADDAYLVTWYEQSGDANAVDFAQTTASLQPTVVAAGVVVTQNGRAAMRQPTNGVGCEFVTLTAWSPRPSSASVLQCATFEAGQTSVVLSTNSASTFLGAIDAGDTSNDVSPGSGSGIAWRSDGADIGAESAGLTQDDMATVLADDTLHVVVATSVDFSNINWTTLRTEYTASTAAGGPEFLPEQIILTDDAERGALEAAMIDYYGTGA